MSTPKNVSSATNIKKQSTEGRADRRDFLKTTSAVAAGGALASLAPSPVHAADENTIRLAIIGSGKRGSGAVVNALSVPNESVELYAMADVFEDRLSSSYRALNRRYADQINVTDDRKFVGFDAYRHAIDCLRPGDVAMLTTHCGFRPVHFAYAVERGVNVFMEKSFAPDPKGLKEMLALGEIAQEKNLKIAAGLMCRHSPARQEMLAKVRDGVLGDILFMRAYRLQNANISGRRPENTDELEWQLRGAKHYLWASGGRYIDWLIHQVDECCWLKDSWPVSAVGLSGRQVGSTDYSQNLDAYAVEYTWEDGAKAIVELRTANRCHAEFATYAHGTQKACQFSGSHHNDTLALYRNNQIKRQNVEWRPEEESVPLHQYEWQELLASIRQDRPHNETERAVKSNLAAMMGRSAAHSGKQIDWQAALNSDFQFCDRMGELDYNSPAPTTSDDQGRYPTAVPGVWTEM